MLDKTNTKVLFICIISGIIMILLMFTINYPKSKLYDDPLDIRYFRPEWNLTYSLFSIPMGIMIICFMWLFDLDKLYDYIDFKKLKEYYKKELMIYRNK